MNGAGSTSYPQTNPQPQGTTPSDASGMSLPGTAAGTSHQELARAACFFTTLPSIRIGH